MKHLLIHIRPRDPQTGLRVDVRLGSGPVSLANGLGGFVWETAVVERPSFMQDLMSLDLDGRVQTARGSFAVNTGQIRRLGAGLLAAGLDWAGAPITVYDATGLDYATMPIEFKGVVKQPGPDVEEQRVALELEVEKTKLERPLLTLEYDGSGGMGGDAEKRGTLKPAGFGYNEDVEPVWIDVARNIGQIDGYGNTQAIHALFEGASDFGPPVADYPTFAALAAAIDTKAVPPGRWATCVAWGLIGLGAKPAGIITVDATFGTNRPGAMMRRWIETHAGVPVEDVDTASFAALDAAVPRAVHYWTATQREVIDLVEAMSGSCNATTLVLLNGKIAVTRVFGGAVIGNFDRGGTSKPMVTDWRVGEALAPVWRMRAVCARRGRVLAPNEINYEDTLEDKGAYVGTETYRQGHLVWLPDGSQWLYINALPSDGHAPPVGLLSDDWWQRTRAPTAAADLYYADGTSIEALKPEEPGANMTEGRTAAAIVGQGTGATSNSLADLDAAANDILLSTARPGQNVLYNGSLKLGFGGWNSGGFGYAADWRGNIVQQPVGTGGVFVMQSTRPINSGPNEPVVVSAQFTGTASPNAFVFVDIEWRNGGNGATIQFSSDTPGQNGVLFRDETGSRVRKHQALMSPSSTDGSGFVRGYVRVVGISDVAYADSTRWVEQIKVERGTVPTPFSDEATNGADVGNAVGRFDSGTYLPTNWNIGIKALNLSGFVLSDSAAGATVTLNIGASTYRLDDGRTLNYPAASVPGLGYSALYFVWRNDPDLNGGTSYGVSQFIQDALGPGKVYLGYFTTRATSGGTGGGGSGGKDFCVAHGMYVCAWGCTVLAEDVEERVLLRTLDKDLQSLDWTPVTSNEAHENECVTIRTRLGAELTLALNTPCVTESGAWVMAANAWMVRLPVLRAGELVWDEVVDVDPVGRRAVAAIKCQNATYAAGADPDLMILTHNAVQKP